MATTKIFKVRDICEDALRKIGVVSHDEAMQAHDADIAARELCRMAKSWQNRSFNLWAYTEQTLTLTTAASYSLTVERPLRILNARFVNTSGTETPMEEMTREEYDTLPVKDSTGTPTTFYYDRQREDALFYVWPLLSSASGQTIKITYERELDDMLEMTDTLDFPGEWWSAVVYGLADRLQDDFGTNNQRVSALAQMELEVALSADREGSVFFA